MESKIILIVFVIDLLVAVLGTFHIWENNEYGYNSNMILSIVTVIPLLVLVIGIVIDIKNYEDDAS